MITYYAILRYKATGNSIKAEFSSPESRALTIVALGDAVKVLGEGTTES